MIGSIILWSCALVVIGVFAVMIHSIATFSGRASVEERAQPRALTEILWAIVPIFIMVSTALPAVRMLTADITAHAVQAKAVPEQNGPLFTTSAVRYNADRQ
jgi:heme/copper-type cytochrome/quinol oxidase subunit 2